MTTRGKVAEFYDHMGRQFAEKCDSCGDCLQVCSVFPLTRFADRGPRAVMEKITDLLQGSEVSEEAYDMAFSCNLACGRCDKACPGISALSRFHDSDCQDSQRREGTSSFELSDQARRSL